LKLGKKVWLFLLLVGLITSFFVGWQRNQVERANRTVEIALDYQDVVNLAQSQAYNLEKVLQKFKEAGVTSAAISELTLDDLEKSGQVGVLTDAQVASVNLLTGQGIVPPVTGGQTYLLTYEKDIYQQLKESLANKLGKGKVQDQSKGNKYILQVMLPVDQIRELPLFLPQEQLAKAQALGFKIIPRLGNYTRVDRPGVDRVFDQLKGYEQNLSTIAFLGGEALGYKVTDNVLEATKNNMVERHLKVALIEFNQQKGLTTLTKELDYQGIRLHSIPAKEAEKMTMSTALARWTRAVQERNIRIIYLRPMTNQAALQGKDPLIANINYVRDIQDNLKNTGFQVGQAEPFRYYQVSALAVLLISLGVLAGAVLLWQMFFPTLIIGEYLIFLGGLGVVLALFFTGHLYQARKLLALGAAITFPALGIIKLLAQWREGKKVNPFLALLQGVLYSVVGGLFIATLLADTSFFLKLNEFSGVKFMHLVPLFLVTLYYLLFFTKGKEKRIWSMLQEFLNQPILVKYLLAFFLAAGMAVVYILRTGNKTGPLPVSGLEMKLRHFLEVVLVARPRTSEFLLGHPALMLAAAWAAVRKFNYLLPLLLLASIGQISITSTFTHVHTPLYMSLLRAFNGLVLGWIIGSVVIFLGKFIQRGED